MHEWERIGRLPSKEKLEKAWRILEEQVWSEMRVFWDRNREVSWEKSKKNDFRITQRPYIKQLVNLDRCRYREVSRDLSRRCRENARRQLRCWEGIEEQHIRINNRSSIDPLGVEKLSRRQKLSWSIHQVSRRCWDCVKKKAWEARQIARYWWGQLFKIVFWEEKNIDMNAIQHKTQQMIQLTQKSLKIVSQKNFWAQRSPKHTHTHTH